jgi:hypothetical protein
VVVACWTPVLVFVAVTAAPGIAAPLASFTLPEMLPPTPAHVTSARHGRRMNDAIAKIFRKTTFAGSKFGPCVLENRELESRTFSVANPYQLREIIPVANHCQDLFVNSYQLELWDCAALVFV